jgi:DNA-binding NarL/FixJ family response regulator
VREADRVREERVAAAGRAALGEVGYELARAAGRALAPEEIVAEATAAADDAATVRQAPARPPAPAPGRPEHAVDLTPREREVLRQLAAGQTDREIAAALFVSPKTASNHVASILAKLGVETRTAAAAFALRHGLA